MNDKQRWTVVPAVYLILIKNGQILLLRRANTGYQDGNYSLPAGHLNGGESAQDAMVREADEEIGVSLDPANLELVHTQHRLAEEADHERIDLYFKTTNWQGEIVNKEPNKCDDLRWFNVDELPSNLIVCVRIALDNIKVKKYYSDVNL